MAKFKVHMILEQYHEIEVEAEDAAQAVDKAQADGGDTTVVLDERWTSRTSVKCPDGSTQYYCWLCGELTSGTIVGTEDGWECLSCYMKRRK